MKALKSALASFIATIVLSASGIALAADGDVAGDVNNSGVVADVVGNVETTVERTAEGTTEGTVEGVADGTIENNSDVSDNSKPGDTTSNTDTDFVWDDCSSKTDAEGNLVQKCEGRDADGNPVAKSTVALPEDNDSQSVVSTNAEPQGQTDGAPISHSESTSLPVAGGAVNLPVSKGSNVEKPNLPVTCGSKSVTVASAKKTTKGCDKNATTATDVANVANAASAALVIDNALITASSRASLFAMVACAMFVVVGAGSVVSVRRLQH